MSISLDALTKYPAIWLGVYACGSVMVVATIAHVAGGTAAGSAAGLLALAGTFGYDSLTRRSVESRFARRVKSLEATQEQLLSEVSATVEELEIIKEDLERGTSSRTSKKQMAPRAPFMPQQKPANISASAPEDTDDLLGVSDTTAVPDLVAPRKPLSLTPRAQKYKDILKNWSGSPKAGQDNRQTAGGSAKVAVSSPQDYSESVVAELLHRALENDRIEIFAQPIVRLPSRKLAFVELFARIRAKAGVYLGGDKYRRVAEREGIIENIDMLILRHATHTVLHDAYSGVNVGYFINIAANTLSNRVYVSELVDFLKSNRDLSDRFIFELRYDDFCKLSAIHARVLRGLCSLGCRLSLDNMETDANFDPTDLDGQNISFVKYSSQRLVDMCAIGQGPMDVARLKSAFDSCDITLIVEKFEDEHDVLELLDFEIDYGEGYLFGKPDLEIAYRSRQRA